MSFTKTVLKHFLFGSTLLSLLLGSAVLIAESASPLSSKSVYYSTSFEEVEPSPLSKRQIDSAIWVANSGHAEISNRYAFQGKQSLHLKGGANRVVTVKFKDPISSGTFLKFQAERWTVRSPYEFRIEAKNGEGWSEIFNGDEIIRVGRRFLTHVECPVPEKATALRFKNTAPINGGTLIDDVSLRKPSQMKLKSFAVKHLVNPVLIGKKDNSILKFSLKTEGNLVPKSIEHVTLSMDGTTDFTDIAAIRIYRDQHLFGEVTKVTESISITGSLNLEEGDNVFRVSIELKAEVDQDHFVRANLLDFKVDGVIRKSKQDVRPPVHRVGIALRLAGQDQCHTYRIPGLATTSSGALIAVYDNRYRSSGDLPGDIDVGMSRSTDGGRHWEPMRVIMDMGNDPDWKYDGIGDPSILVDQKTGRIWVAATWSHGDRSWNGSGPGMKPEETGQLMLTYSDDDGLTWSKPNNITRQIKKTEWRFVLQGPGKGISMKDGTLVFPAQFRGKNSAPINGKPSSTLIYSKDHGKTWSIGKGVKIDTTEAQLVELGDGSIMINCRDNRNRSGVDGLYGRTIAVTKDLGNTWQKHQTDRTALVEPTCMASLIRVEHPKHGALLLFSNPATQEGRFDMTLKMSNDEGFTWPEKWHTLYDARRGAGYSCLTQIDENHIGVLYEGNRELYFLRFSITELLKSQ